MQIESVLEQVLSSTALFLIIWGLLGLILRPFIDLIFEREEKTVGYEKEALRKRDLAIERRGNFDDALRDTRMSAIGKRDAVIGKARDQAQTEVELASRQAAERLGRAREEIARLASQAHLDAQHEVRRLAELLQEKTLELSGSSTLH